jgi:hypothetical protein|tara:strand:- start:686 stop:1216 length:531 start_codon:yes stop_codon:yes gene_type:complete
MGKLTWKSLGFIYGHKQFGMTPEEASDVLQKYLFTDTTWKGSQKVKGRVWRDKESRVALVCLVREHQKLRKKNYHNSTRELFFKSPEFEMFSQVTNILYKKNAKGFKNFQNDFAIWKKLPDIKGFYEKNDSYTKKAMRRVKKITDDTAKIFTDNARRMKAEGRIQLADGTWKPTHK